MRIKKNDTVVVLNGRDRGRQGKVMEFTSDGQRLRVEGVNMIKRHVKAGRDPKAPQGGIIEAPAPIHLSNVKLVCSHCGEKIKARMKSMDSGKRQRVCPACNESVDKG